MNTPHWHQPWRLVNNMLNKNSNRITGNKWFPNNHFVYN